MYPNPTDGKFIIDFGRIRGRLTIRSFSVSGQLMETFNTQNVDHFNIDTKIPGGLYFIEIEDFERNKSNLKLINN